MRPGRWRMRFRTIRMWLWSKSAIFTFLHVWLAFLLCYLWLRARTGKLASALGASVFASTGYMSWPRAPYSGGSIGSTSGGSSRKSSFDISAAAWRTDYSVVGSSVITNGRSSLFSCGSCSTASMPMRLAARMPESAAMMPGWSRTRNRT